MALLLEQLLMMAEIDEARKFFNDYQQDSGKRISQPFGKKILNKLFISGTLLEKENNLQLHLLAIILTRLKAKWSTGQF